MVVKRTLATLRECQPGSPEGGHLSEAPVRTRYLLCSVAGHIQSGGRESSGFV